MKYSYEERLEIGRKLYHDELSRFEASERYGISINSARDYMRLYRDENKLPPKTQWRESGEAAFASRRAIYDGFEAYESMSKEELLPMYRISRSMSRAGTPTDNAAMEAVNGWIKAELFMDFHVTGTENVEQVSDYIRFFNDERPAYSLHYMTPKQFRESHFQNSGV